MSILGNNPENIPVINLTIETKIVEAKIQKLITMPEDIATKTLEKEAKHYFLPGDYINYGMEVVSSWENSSKNPVKNKEVSKNDESSD